MPDKKKVCIVGGGATGAALLWALSQDAEASQEWEITLIHSDSTVGGHSRTFSTVRNGETLYIDIGVQFIAPMLYPNLHMMLGLPDFQAVQVRDYNELRIACAFPRDTAGNKRNWGNFPAYQSGDQFETLYDSDMQKDIGELEAFIEVSGFEGWGKRPLQDFFDSPPHGVQLNNSDKFRDYFVAPYMSIINGYGAALLDQTLFFELMPLFGTLPVPKSWGFPTPLGSFNKPGVGWRRFAQGAQSWVQAMADAALKHAPASRLLFNSSVTAVWTDQTTGQVTVQWKDQDIQQDSDTFDKVILTTDMWTNSKLLNNPQNQYFWDNLYEKYVGYGKDQNGNPLGSPVVWDLMYGACYVHTDQNILSPDLRNQQETNQFNAYYAGTGDGGYNLWNTFTTYIQKNVLGTPSDPDMNADGIYLTMYGYVPQPGQTVPDQSTWLTDPILWTHGNWTPAAMGGAKSNLYLAQGKGNIAYDGQMDTNVYFAGNNATVDSEEGALISAMTIAEYAFGVNYPLAKFSGDSLFAFAMYRIYHNVMFPKQNTSHAVAALYQMLPEKPQWGSLPAPRMALSSTQPRRAAAASSGKGSNATRRKKVARKRPNKPARTTARATKKGTKGSAGGKTASKAKKTAGKTSGRKAASTRTKRAPRKTTTR